MNLYQLRALPLVTLNAIWRIAKNDGRGRPFVNSDKAAAYIWNTSHRNPETVAAWYGMVTGGGDGATIATASGGDIDTLLTGSGGESQAQGEQSDDSAINQQSEGDGTMANATVTDAAKALADALAEAAKNNKAQLDPEEVRAIVKAEIEAAKLPRVVTHTVKLERADGTAIEVTGQHKAFADVMRAAIARVHVWLAGPAGSGKSHTAKAIAQALGLPFRFSSTLLQPYDVTGYVDGAGLYHATPFYHAFKDGGVFLADEADGWDSNAFLALNAALANGQMEFPNGEQIKAHPDFICIAAANTWGMGANFAYVGRNKLDASTLDRFVTLAFDYDEGLEMQIAGNEGWTRRVQAWRAKAFAKGLQVVISPRASIMGAKLLAAGFPESQVIEMAVKKSMSADQWAAIQ